MLTFRLNCSISEPNSEPRRRRRLRMTNSPIAKTTDRFQPPSRKRLRPDEERIGRSYISRQRRGGRLLRRTLLMVVATPTLIAALYFSLWAAPRYVSETQFIVRRVQGSVPIGMGSGLQGIMQAIGRGSSASSPDDANAVLQYLQSRDAVNGLEAALPLRKMYARDEADAPARFPRPFLGDSFEWLYRYYNNRTVAWIDPDTGFITVQVEAFRPGDARAIVRQLLSQAEALVNAMNDRLESELVRSAEAAVAEAQKAVLAAQEDVDRFRNAEIVVDPSQNAVAQLGTITALSGQVDQVLAQILQNNKLSPSSPRIAGLKAQADALSAQVKTEQRGLAGSQEAVSNKVSAYERLTLLRSLAEASLAAARTSLDTARDEARLQQVFIEDIVRPNLPDYATEPRRLRSVATVFAISIAAFAVLWLASIGVKESGH
jgi:capsular polysaccharide transport system permease protein